MDDPNPGDVGDWCPNCGERTLDRRVDPPGFVCWECGWVLAGTDQTYLSVAEAWDIAASSAQAMGRIYRRDNIKLVPSGVNNHMMRHLGLILEAFLDDITPEQRAKEERETDILWDMLSDLFFEAYNGENDGVQ